MELTILDEALRQNVREVLIVTSRGSQFQISEGRDGTLVVAAGVPVEVEPYSLGVVVLRQVEGRWEKESEGG
mgnify:CR=1 FL=1